MTADRARDVIGLGTRFRRNADWFIASKRDGLHVARVGTTGERAVDLLHALAFHLDPAVDVVIDSLFEGRAWQGSFLALPDVRDALGRLKLTLATYGGVEISLYTPDDQLTLTPELVLYAYARSDRWLFLLEGMGLEERVEPPPVVWHPSRRKLEAPAELVDAVRAAVDRLALTPIPSQLMSQE